MSKDRKGLNFYKAKKKKKQLKIRKAYNFKMAVKEKLVEEKGKSQDKEQKPEELRHAGETQPQQDGSITERETWGIFKS